MSDKGYAATAKKMQRKRKYGDGRKYGKHQWGPYPRPTAKAALGEKRVEK